MKFRNIIWLVTFVTSSVYAAEVISDDFACQPTDDLSEAARAVMARNHLILTNDEVISGGLTMRWALTKAAINQDRCILTMNLCVVTQNRPNPKHCSGTVLEVLALGNDRKPALFEAVVSVPTMLRFASDGYYAEVSGASALGATKAVYAKVKNLDLFRGTIIGGSKSSFDPTPNRMWRVVDARVSLRATIWPEAMNVAAIYFDNDFDHTFETTIHETSSTGVEGSAVGFGSIDYILN